MKFPEFIIIGAAKCGTTALWYNLDKHPKITMASKSSTSVEMDFFGGKKKNKGLAWYKSRFSGEVSGEKSTGYCQKRGAMINIKRHMPDVKLILCVRNPVDRAYSHYQMNKNTNSNKRITAAFTFSLFKKKYAQDGKYINMIKKIILPRFDRSQLYVCPAEIMKRDMTSGMRDIFSYIGVDDLNLPAKKISYMQGRTRQEDIKLNRDEKYYRVWSKFTEKLSGPLRKQLLEFYKKTNEKLFDYLGYEIEEWRK
jgi:hypothetical protein